jgi:hypothetical protein
VRPFPALIAVACLAVGGLASACGSYEEPPGEIAAGATSSAAETSAREEVGGPVESARIEMRSEFRMGDVEQVSRGVGVADFVRQRSFVILEYPFPGGEDPRGDRVPIAFRVIGDVTYTGFAADGQDPWVENHTDGIWNEHSFFGNPGRLFPALREEATRVDFVGTDRVRGADCDRYHLTYPETSEPQSGGMVETESWPPDEVCVDTSGVVRRTRFSSGLPDGDYSFVVTTDYWDLGVPVEVEPPPEDLIVPAEEYFEEDLGSKLPECPGGAAGPITTDRALGALREHGFSAVEDPTSCAGADDIVMALTNMDAADEEGLVLCEVRRAPIYGDGFSKLPATDMTDTHWVQDNVECFLYPRSPPRDELNRLRAAMRELASAP